jgi:hypothetical protein
LERYLNGYPLIYQLLKGPESVGVVRFCREINAESVCGNHDFSILQWKSAVVEGRTPKTFSGLKTALMSRLG